MKEHNLPLGYPVKSVTLVLYQSQPKTIEASEIWAFLLSLMLTIVILCSVGKAEVCCSFTSRFPVTANTKGSGIPLDLKSLVTVSHEAARCLQPLKVINAQKKYSLHECCALCILE